MKQKFKSQQEDLLAFEPEYTALERMQKECEVFLRRHDRQVLSCGTPEKQIRNMQSLHDCVPVKPENLQKQIDLYAYRMGVPTDGAYEAYKQAWISEHVSEKTLETTRSLYLTGGYAEHMTFEEYVQENGYGNGMMYACREEFFDNECREIQEAC